MAEGTPCWADLALASDPGEDLTAFYAAVLGWTFSSDGGASHHRAVARASGSRVAGIGAPDGSPPGWILYVAVEDAADAAEEVEEAGGQVLGGPDDDGRNGLVVVGIDAGGAPFGLWESDPDPDDPAVAPAWVEAASAEPGQTRTFYARLLGATHRPTDEPGTTTLHTGGGEPFGAVVFAGDALPHWLIHFPVADGAAVDHAAEAAPGAGGEVVGTPEEHPQGRRAVLLDPTGARFAVIG